MSIFDSIRKLLGLSVPEHEVSTPAPVPEESPLFPFPLVTVHGNEALSTWRRLRSDQSGWPVILGGDEDLTFLKDGIEEIDQRPVSEIIEAARTLTFPQSLIDRRADDERRAREWLLENGHAEEDEDESWEPEIGDWPDEVHPTGLTIANDLNGRPLDHVHIAILPCATGWEAIAYLRWGNWNENPAAEYHIAALRSWNERFGAELVGLSHDVINLHVATRPATRETALALAREQYAYCADIVDQGTGTLAVLAATLMADDWWYFWWD